MDLGELCAKMPKVELHVHLEGSIRPETVLKLARRNSVSLPADDLEGLRAWYRFQNFRHFVEVYVAVTKSIKTPDDIELIVREFAEGQLEQNILRSEVTYTASTVERFIGIPWADQHKALVRGIEYGKEIGVSIGFIVDIVRGCEEAVALNVAEWATTSEGVIALGLAGEEHRGTAIYQSAYDLAHERGFPVIAHAGETQGPEVIWETLESARPLRIGHGVRAMADPKLVDELRKRQIPLEVCPSSNVALGVFDSLENHPLPTMLDEGLYVTINSDDPPMFGTTLTEEYVRTSEAFGFNEDILWSLNLNAAKASLLAPEDKTNLINRMRKEFTELTSEQ